MKKIIQIFLAILLAIPVVGQQVEIVDVNNAQPGLVSVTINMTGGYTNVGSLDFKIELDEYLLTYSNYTPGAGLGTNYFINQSGSELSVAWLTNDFFNGNTINGTFITLKFEYNGGFPAELNFDTDVCEILKLDGDPIPSTYIDGTITPDLSNPDGSATIGEVTAIAGADVSVPLTLAHLGGFSGVASSITLRVAYDAAKLTFNSVSNNGIGFSVSGSNGEINLQKISLTPLAGFPYSVNLNFTYLGGGQADIEFLPGSVVEDNNGVPLVTLFDDGYVDIDITGPGEIKIAKVSSAEGQWVNLPDPPGQQEFEPVAVLVPVTAKYFTGIDVGAIELKIAFDQEMNNQIGLNYTGFVNGPLGAGWSVVQNPGYLQFSRISATPLLIPDNTVLFTLKFDYYSGTSDITFETGTVVNRVNGTPIPVNLVDGWVASFVTLNLKFYLEGFYLGSDVMRKAQEWNGSALEDKFAGTIADKFTVELHDNTAYGTVVWSQADVDLNADGTASLQVPSQYNGEYYLTLKHRNHLETVSSAPVNFGVFTVNYDFTDAATKAYGNNLKELVDGKFGIFAGDVNQDGFINVADRSLVQSALLALINGYVVEDVNGDGNVNVLDRSLVQTGLLNFVVKITP